MLSLRSTFVLSLGFVAAAATFGSGPSILGQLMQYHYIGVQIGGQETTVEPGGFVMLKMRSGNAGPGISTNLYTYVFAASELFLIDVATLTRLTVESTNPSSLPRFATSTACAWERVNPEEAALHNISSQRILCTDNFGAGPIGIVPSGGVIEYVITFQVPWETPCGHELPFRAFSWDRQGMKAVTPVEYITVACR